MSATLLAPTAQAALSFEGLGDLAGGVAGSRADGVSADGLVVVGTGNWDGATGDAFRWSADTGMVRIVPGGSASAVSADGSVVVGTIGSDEAFRWTAAGGAVGLGDLPGGTSRSIGHAVSADGSVVVGFSSSSVSEVDGFRWTAASGMTRIGDLGGDGLNNRTMASGTSADGSVVVGFSDSAMGTEAFRWTQDDGMFGLGDLAGGVFTSVATRVTPDGSVVIGHGASATGIRAFRWTESTGMTVLGATTAYPGDITADGAIIVGAMYLSNEPNAFIWDELHGTRDLKDVLVASGLNVTGWRLTGANGISDDGSTIVGIGINPQGAAEAWIAVVPEPGTLSLLMLAFPLLRRNRSRSSVS